MTWPGLLRRRETLLTRLTPLHQPPETSSTPSTRCEAILVHTGSSYVMHAWMISNAMDVVMPRYLMHCTYAHVKTS